MNAVAFYNLKGGVGKTTAAVNVAYLAAAAGRRVLLWDLDPQGASSFILRVRAHVGDFGRKAFLSEATFNDAIKETDYRNLDLLPADFSYRKFDRILGELGNHTRVMRTQLDTLGAGYDLVVLDCPAGFSLLTEAVLGTAHLSIVPTIPTPLSVQTLARILKWAERRDSPSRLAPFFSMVDLRKALHRRACEWSARHAGTFLEAQVPCASIVEQISVRRMPLPAFAVRDPASMAFVDLWSEIRAQLGSGVARRPALSAIESLSAELERALERELRGEGPTPVSPQASPATVVSAPSVVHCFDTADRDLERSGHVLELRESPEGLLVVAGRRDDDATRAQVQIDSAWALQILSGEISPVAILDRRLGRPGPPAVQQIRTVVGRRQICRIDSRMTNLSTPPALEFAVHALRAAVG